MKWEYKIVGIRRGDKGDFPEYKELVAKNLNLQGSDNWELVSVDKGIAYFKRPAQPQPVITTFNYNPEETIK